MSREILRIIHAPHALIEGNERANETRQPPAAAGKLFGNDGLDILGGRLVASVVEQSSDIWLVELPER